MDELLAEQTKREAALKQEIEKYDRQIAGLSDEADRKRKKVACDYLERFKDRFKDVDPKLALVGGKVKHAVAFGDTIKFFVTCPTGKQTAEVMKFSQDPKVQSPQSEAEPAGDLFPVELSLLARLTGYCQAGDSEKCFDNMPLATKLFCIRSFPVALTSSIADEAETLEAWLKFYLEKNLGNC